MLKHRKKKTLGASIAAGPLAVLVGAWAGRWGGLLNFIKAACLTEV